jgi:hypothetical protein
VWWSLFIRIIADVALTSDVPVNEDGPDGHRACLIVEPLMIDFTAAPATQNPSSPMTVCTATMIVVTSAADGVLLRR